MNHGAGKGGYQPAYPTQTKIGPSYGVDSGTADYGGYGGYGSYGGYGGYGYGSGQSQMARYGKKRGWRGFGYQRPQQVPGVKY